MITLKDKQIKDEVKSAIIHLVESRKGEKHSNLMADISVAYIKASGSIIDLALSEAVSDGDIRRFEYQLADNRLIFYAFYIPANGRLV